MALTWLALAVLSELVRENNRMSHERRMLCYVEFSLIAAAALAEWCGVALGYLEGLPAWPILVVKWADYVLTPLAGGAIAWQVRQHNRLDKALIALLAFNVVFQTVAFATGSMIVVDEHNHYYHTGLHVVYMAIYIAVFVIAAIQFALYGNKFPNKNQNSLYLTVALAIVGVAMQELLGGEVRVAYLALTLCASFLYIRNGEFFQLEQDKTFAEQHELLMKDDLTGIGNRRAYSIALDELNKNGMAKGTTAFSIDIDGLKEANDTLGHSAGDELIRAAASCIQHVFEPTGKCYRTGGDEFIVLAPMNKQQAKKALSTLNEEASGWRGSVGQQLHLSSGYALATDWPSATAEELVIKADYMMYDAKEAYYLSEGRDRRGRR